MNITFTFIHLQKVSERMSLHTTNVLFCAASSGRPPLTPPTWGPKQKILAPPAAPVSISIPGYQYSPDLSQLRIRIDAPDLTLTGTISCEVVGVLPGCYLKHAPQPPEWPGRPQQLHC